MGECPRRLYLVDEPHSDGLDQLQWTFSNRILSSDAFKSQNNTDNFIHFKEMCPAGVMLSYDDGQQMISRIQFLAKELPVV